MPSLQASSPTANIHNKWAPPLRTVEETTRLLKPDSGKCLEEVKLCWREPGVVKKDSNLTPGILNKKNLASLERALKKTPSRIQKLSVGWKHGSRHKPLIQLLQLFAKGQPALKDLDTIELVLAAWVPDTTLLQLLVPFAPQLKTLHIQATRIKVRTKKPRPSIFKNVYQVAVHAEEYVLEEESVVKLLAAPSPLAAQLTNLTTLSFVDCDILDPEVDILVGFLWRNYSRSGLPSLNLRSNRHMSPRSIQRIVQAPVSEHLDLSLCNINNGGALAIARALQPGNRANWRQQHNITLQELSMCGNYQLDEVGFVPLARTCTRQVQLWDLSYCDWNENQTVTLLQEMTPSLMDPSCPLKELVLQGGKINNDDACRTIQRILQGNRSLVKLTLDDPKYPNPTSINNLRTIVQGLKANYGVCELQLDLRSRRRQQQVYPNSVETCCQVRNEMEFYLRLNHAGRGLLQSDDHLEKEAWISALLKADQTGRLDVLYWLLRHGVVHLF